jgi:hypothetical protein
MVYASGYYRCSTSGVLEKCVGEFGDCNWRAATEVESHHYKGYLEQEVSDMLYRADTEIPQVRAELLKAVQKMKEDSEPCVGILGISLNTAKIEKSELVDISSAPCNSMC